MRNSPTIRDFKDMGDVLWADLSDCCQTIAQALDLPLESRNRSELAGGLRRLKRLRSVLQKQVNSFQQFRKSDAWAAPKKLRPSLQHANMAKETVKLFRELQHLQGKWRSMVALVQDQLDANPGALYPARRSGYDLLSQQTGVADIVFGALNRLANPVTQSPDAAELGCHSDIAMISSVFIADAHAAFRVRLAQKCRSPAQFLDIGCGSGVQLLMAAQFFDRADGLEFDSGYFDSACNLLKTCRARKSQVFRENALCFEGYDTFDVLYFYQPMRDTEDLVALENQITSQTKRGTILIAPYPHFHDRATKLGCAHIEGNVFVAGISTEEGRSLNALAELTGTAIAPRAATVSDKYGFWKPILQASYANGFVPQ